MYFLGQNCNIIKQVLYQQRTLFGINSDYVSYKCHISTSRRALLLWELKPMDKKESNRSRVFMHYKGWTHHKLQQ